MSSALASALRPEPAGTGCPRPIPPPHGTAAVFRTICAQPNAEEVSATWDEVRDQPQTGPQHLVPQDRALDGRRQDRGARLHRVPPPAPAQGVEHQPAGPVNKQISAEPAWSEASPTAPPPSGSSARVLADMHDEWQSGDRRDLSEAPWPSSPPTRQEPSPPSTAATRRRGPTLTAHHPTAQPPSRPRQREQPVDPGPPSAALRLGRWPAG